MPLYKIFKRTNYAYDDLGSVVGEADPSGNLTSLGTYDVYGAKRSGGSGTATTRQGFVGGLGHVTDAETGLVYMRARYYDPATGRFVSEDPKGQGMNWFVYCGNNPVMNTDYTGEEFDWEAFEEQRQVWDYALLNSVAFRDVADAFTTFWDIWLQMDGHKSRADQDFQAVVAVTQLMADQFSAEGKPAMAVSPGEQARAFYAGYDACLELTMLIMDSDVPWGNTFSGEAYEP